jgi:hypothetical protein
MTLSYYTTLSTYPALSAEGNVCDVSTLREIEMFLRILSSELKNYLNSSLIHLVVCLRTGPKPLKGELST